MTVEPTVTPMMAQYLDIKAQYHDAILFYRMGDFYEMFFDDAVAAATALDIALTKRGQHLGCDIPMCGVPVHSAEGYLLTLIRKGFRVAIAEQMEDPAEAKKRGSKSVVKRDVVRLVTPGTLTEETLLEPRRNNFLCAFSELRDEGALAWADISTGELRVMPCPLARLAPELARLAPREVLISETRESDLAGLIADFKAVATPLSRASFDSAAAERRLRDLFAVHSVEAFGQFGRAELSALGALVDYLDVTQRGNLPLLRPPQRELPQGSVLIDPASRRNLELTSAMSGGRDGSLLSAIDRTVTASGARLLERRISSPSTDLELIRARLEKVSKLFNDRDRCDGLREILREVPDIDRALSRLSLERGGPRDLVAISIGLRQAEAVYGRLGDLADDTEATGLTGHRETIDALCAALISQPPVLMREGGFIAPSFDAELDETRRLRDEGRSVIAQLQTTYAELARIPGLKIRHNNVLGYFVEVTATNSARMMSPPLASTFLHRQTTANQMRFTTVELSELENRILNAGNRAVEIEKRCFERLRALVADGAAKIARTSEVLAEIDVTAALADLARREDWCAPELDDSRAFEVEGGRHPVVERALRRDGHAFVANDCELTTGDAPAIWLVTGPNMAGKSTFLRQNALIAVLAQAGSYVPARRARVGLVSQIFSRVGAADDLARGRSTFMVEMVETAGILNQADDRAFVILDEIGRGTATYDGLSIAWAVLEHLHNTNRCRALFATHYHEMTGLATQHAGVENATVAVKEWQGEVIFLHEVRKGAADRSYGVQVARLAGLPQSVVDRARAVLETLEKGEREGWPARRAVMEELPLFAPRPNMPTPPATMQKPSRVETMLGAINPDELSPREALTALYELRAALRETEIDR